MTPPTRYLTAEELKKLIAERAVVYAPKYGTAESFARHPDDDEHPRITKEKS